MLGSFMSAMEDYGSHRFSGAVADEYLGRQGLPAGLLDQPSSWVSSEADKVAAAVQEWATDRGASMYAHWAQPLGSAGVRSPGLSAPVTSSMFGFGPRGKPEWSQFGGKELLLGEIDISALASALSPDEMCPTEPAEAGHTATGYAALDPTSAIILRGETVYLPSVLVSPCGTALDEKTPLLRATQALSREASQLLTLLGHPASSVSLEVGLEQDFYLIPLATLEQRPDLQRCGRSLVGRIPARHLALPGLSQAPTSQASLACIREIQHECFMMGIPLKAHTAAVAPSQFTFRLSPAAASSAMDHYVVMAHLMHEVATRHGLACLTHSAPFEGLPASRKRAKVSLVTPCGMNLLDPTHLARSPAVPEAFALLMALALEGISRHGSLLGSLLMTACAAPGDRGRLRSHGRSDGAAVSPPFPSPPHAADSPLTSASAASPLRSAPTPSPISVHISRHLTAHLNQLMLGGGAQPPYLPASQSVSLGIDAIPPIRIPAEEFRTSAPLARGLVYRGGCFEFGCSAWIALPVPRPSTPMAICPPPPPSFGPYRHSSAPATMATTTIAILLPPQPSLSPYRHLSTPATLPLPQLSSL